MNKNVYMIIESLCCTEEINFVNQVYANKIFHDFFFFFFAFLGPHPQHMEVPRLRVKSELWQPAYTTATATQDPSHVFDLHHSSWQCRICNPLSKASDRTCNLMAPRRNCFHTPRGELLWFLFLSFFFFFFLGLQLQHMEVPRPGV